MEKVKRYIFLLAAGILLISVGYIAGFSQKQPQYTSEVEQPQNSQSLANIENTKPEIVQVTRVIDGDTIEIGEGKRIRLIGIDTPEINRTGETGCFGKEAANYATKLLSGQSIRLEKDISEVDRYNRLLRYIYLGDVMINDKLVRDGYARVYTYPPDVKYKDKFLESEKFARENNLGLWSKCVSIGSSELIVSGASTINNQSINCSGNSYNCSDFKTQAEAQNVFDMCMRKVGYDVHKLDRDGDDRVCETLP